MKKHVSVAFACFFSFAACAPKPTDAPLPPAGLAGAPASPSNPTTIDPAAPMPAGHPPVGHGGDDGAPLPTKGSLPLPNFGEPQGDTTGGGGAPGGGGMFNGGAAVVFSGKVLEKVDVPSYTYMRVQTSGGTEEWVAVSTMAVQVGDVVTIQQQLVMNNFASKALNRTFEKLVMGTATVGG